jgi:hypothetical protein
LPRISKSIRTYTKVKCFYYNQPTFA